MRIVFVGAGSLSVTTARLLLKHGHDVVIVERDKDRIDELSKALNCGFLHGDGSKPAILRESDPPQTDILFCLTGDDQTNILASLVGRSLGIERVVTKIADSELEHICIELGLKDTIVPSRTIGRYLTDMVEGQDPLQLSTMIRDEARAFSFVVHDDDECKVEELDLPDMSRVVCVYRNAKFLLPDTGDRLKAGDEVVIITHRDNVSALRERWSRH